MRKVIFGIVFPLAVFVVIVLARGATDICPYQLVWLLWVSSILVDGIVLGIGIRAYWIEGGHRTDSRKNRR